MPAVISIAIDTFVRKLSFEDTAGAVVILRRFAQAKGIPEEASDADKLDQVLVEIVKMIQEVATEADYQERRATFMQDLEEQLKENNRLK